MRLLSIFSIMTAGFAFALQMTAAAHAERRVALIIGNDKYEHLATLKKAVADAAAYADVLKGKGFDQVMLKTDLSRSGMDEAIATFIDQIQPGDIAVFGYSGHGWSDGTQDYIVGIDAPLSGSQELLARISIPLKDGAHGVIDEMDRQGAALKVAIIDACRDNPFKPVPGQKGVGISRGLARIEPPHGSFVVFSAGAGQSALDRLSDGDPDPNSVFTRIFAACLRADLTLQEAIKTTQEKVVALARSIQVEQNPAYYDEVIGSACLSASCNGAGRPAAPPPENETIAADYQAAAAVGTATAAWEFFLKKHQAKTDNFYVGLANENLAALEPPGHPPNAEVKPSDCPGGLVVSVGNAGVATAAERCLKPKDVFTDCSDICPKMVVIPAGRFTMGSPASEQVRFDNEGPQHEVRIGAPFAVAKLTVTFDEWDACVSDGGCGGYRPDDNSWGRKRRPVIYVSWDDAKAYLAWLSHKTGKPYRLLTEAEREYVTRAGTTTPYWWGTSISKGQANYRSKKTVPADSFEVNPFGLYNVHGNVWEWQEDCFHDTYAGAPNDGSAWTSGSCEYRVLRGGAWDYGPRGLHAAFRFRGHPDYRDGNIGFRVARTL
jgi:formylglycine-generating enzyme required for sulfatase activity